MCQYYCQGLVPVFTVFQNTDSCNGQMLATLMIAVKDM